MVNNNMVNTRVAQVNNVSSAATMEQLRTLFGFLGKIEDIRLFPKEDSVLPVTVRICFVRFEDATSVGMAQHLSNTVFLDKALNVVPFPDGVIPEESKALQMVAASSGGLVSMMNNAGASLLPTPPQPLLGHLSGAMSGVSIPVSNPTPLDTSLASLTVPALPPLTNVDPSKVEEIRRTVYVGNLDSGTVTAEQLLTFFQKVGEVKYVRMAGDETQPTRFAFVEFSEPTSVANALAYNGVMFAGRPLKINHSNNAIVKPPGKTQEAIQKELAQTMKQVRDAQALIQAAIDPELKTTNGQPAGGAATGTGTIVYRMVLVRDPIIIPQCTGAFNQLFSFTEMKVPEALQDQIKALIGADAEKKKKSRSRSPSKRKSRSRSRRRSRSKSRDRHRSRSRRSRSRGRRSRSPRRRSSPIRKRSRSRSRHRRSRSRSKDRRSRSRSAGKKPERERKKRSRTPPRGYRSRRSRSRSKGKKPESSRPRKKSRSPSPPPRRRSRSKSSSKSPRRSSKHRKDKKRDKSREKDRKDKDSSRSSSSRKKKDKESAEKETTSTATPAAGTGGGDGKKEEKGDSKIKRDYDEEEKGFDNQEKEEKGKEKEASSATDQGADETGDNVNTEDMDMDSD